METVMWTENSQKVAHEVDPVKGEDICEVLVEARNGAFETMAY